MMDLNNIWLLIVTTVFIPFVLEIVRSIMAGIKPLFGKLWERLFGQIKQITDVYSVSITYSITYIESAWKCWPSEENNFNLMSSILEFLTINGLLSSQSKLKLDSKVDETIIADTADKLRSKILKNIPLTPIYYGEFIISYSEIIEEKKCTYTLNIASKTKTTADINAFIRKCYDDYITRYHDSEKNKRFMYTQIPNRDGMLFKRYEINNSTTFDNIYLPEKNKILELLKKYNEGSLQKLSFMLNGSPGCGKTSLIKAIANFLGYHVVVIKLSYMLNDMTLMDIFHCAKYPCHIYEDRLTLTRTNSEFVPKDKRIYIFEDVDAESDVVHSRKNKMSVTYNNTSNDPQTISADKMYEIMIQRSLERGLTLSGILNVLDGVLEINRSVIIMTTNHLEKLDPAFYRPGRITVTIELKKMLAEYGNYIVEKQFNSRVSNLRDYTTTPAELVAMCQVAANVKELSDMIDQHQLKVKSN